MHLTPQERQTVPWRMACAPGWGCLLKLSLQHTWPETGIFTLRLCDWLPVSCYLVEQGESPDMRTEIQAGSSVSKLIVRLWTDRTRVHLHIASVLKFTSCACERCRVRARYRAGRLDVLCLLPVTGSAGNSFYSGHPHPEEDWWGLTADGVHGSRSKNVCASVGYVCVCRVVHV